MKPSVLLEPIDQWIIVTYFLLVVTVGVLVSRAASRDLTEYFLGGRRIPWWVLGFRAALRTST
jgi:Na+/proline symporter